MFGYNVKNRGYVFFLAWKTFLKEKRRNLIAFIAIILTTLLFSSTTALVISILNSSTDEFLRAIGGDAHSFVYGVTRQEAELIEDDERTSEVGMLRSVGSVEADLRYPPRIVYADDDYLDMRLEYFEEGKYPEEENEIAVTRAYLDSISGSQVEYGIGDEITITILEGDVSVSSEFVICGIVNTSSNLYVTEAKAEELAREIANESEAELVSELSGNLDNEDRSWTCLVNLHNSNDIAGEMSAIFKDNNITFDINNNKAYFQANYYYADDMNQSEIDTTGVLAFLIVAAFFCIIGYLIIYNIFSISVNDSIRFYGVLRTIGTTKKQIKRIVLYQALFLCLIAIPLGNLLGLLFAKLFLVEIAKAINIANLRITLNAWMFVLPSLFAFVTVMISCFIPARAASNVTPIEAVRHSNNSKIKQSTKEVKLGIKSKNKSAVLALSTEYVFGSKLKNALAIISISIACAMLIFTSSFLGGIDEDKILGLLDYDYSICIDLESMSADEASLDYTDENLGAEFPSFIGDLENTPGFEESSIVYGSMTYMPTTYVSQEILFKIMYCGTEEDQAELLQYIEPNEEGLYEATITVLGYEENFYHNLEVYEGSLDSMYTDEVSNAAALGTPGHETAPIVLLLHRNEFGEVDTSCTEYEVGDIIEISYPTTFEYYYLIASDIENAYNVEGPIEVDEIDPSRNGIWHPSGYTTYEYEIAAIATTDNSNSGVFYEEITFVVPDEIYVAHSERADVMRYFMNVDNDYLDTFDAYAEKHFSNSQITRDYMYTSLKTERESVENLKNIVLLLGAALTIIMGLVGILNFINVIITNINSRRKELAIMQAIGMTSKQMKQMLILEAVTCVSFSFVLTILLSILFNFFVIPRLNDILWFMTLKTSITPILVIVPVLFVLAFIIPMLVYRRMKKQSVVERIRYSE